MKHKLLDNNTVIFDAKDILDGRKQKGKILLKMVPADDSNLVPASYCTSEQVTFYKDHPYQYVSEGEAIRLLSGIRPRFRNATREELEDYYRD